MPLDHVTSRLHTRCVKHRRLGEVGNRRTEGGRNKERVPGSESAIPIVSARNQTCHE